MTVTNGYTTLAKFKAAVTPNATMDAGDDVVMEDIITAASRTIDTLTGRTFYARSETHYYDVPDGSELFINDDDLLTVTTLTNGDASVIASTNYQLLPLNGSPKYAIRLKSLASVYWLDSATTGGEGAITVAGTWGWAATTPADIEIACIAMARAEYQRRYGQNVSEDSIVTPAGMVVSAGGVPKSAWKIIQNYRRRV
jgi:hypothetical protein